MSTIFDEQAAPVTAPAPLSDADGHQLYPHSIHDAARYAVLAVQRGLAANWDDNHPRIAVVERDDATVVYVSTIRSLGPDTRSDVLAAAREALTPYLPVACSTNVVFLVRKMP